jgi:hypothetical protein
MSTTTATTAAEPVDNVVIFKSICNFIRDLNFAFGDRLPPIQLYAHLLEKTGLFYEEILKKHIVVFEDFMKENEEAILQRSVGLLQTNHIIRYSERVYVDLNDVLMVAEADDMETVWTHLLTIYALLHPESKAKDVLKRQKIQAAVTQHRQQEAAAAAAAATAPAAGGDDEGVEDPMAMIGTMFQGLLGGMMAGGNQATPGGEGGSAPPPNPFGALFQSMQEQMANGVAEGGEGAGGEPNPMKMLSSLMSSPVVSNLMKSLGGKEGSEMDMSKMMEGMQKTMSTLQNVLVDASNKSKTAAAPVVEGGGNDIVQEEPSLD